MALRGLPPLGDLFVEGKELVLKPPAEDGTGAVVVWVNKLNPFQMDEARRAGAVAKARLILAMKEVGSPEYQLYHSQVASFDAERMRKELLDNKQTEWWAKAFNAVRQDPEWTERAQMVQAPLDGASPEEVEAMAKLQRDYLAEIDRRVTEYREARERELLELDDASLREEHEETWLESQGLTAFTREFQRHQIFLAMRICRAAKTEGGWDHSGCDHGQQTCEAVSDVATLPDRVLTGVLTTLQAVTVAVDDARFSAEAATSSAPSPQRSKAEESVPSGQEVTSGELVTTS